MGRGSTHFNDNYEQVLYKERERAGRLEGLVREAVESGNAEIQMRGPTTWLGGWVRRAESALRDGGKGGRLPLPDGA